MQRTHRDEPMQFEKFMVSLSGALAANSQHDTSTIRQPLEKAKARVGPTDSSPKDDAVASGSAGL